MNPWEAAMTAIDSVRRLLLISNSTLYGSGYLDHAEREIRDFLGNTARVIFVPFAVHDLRVYAAKAQERFREMGFVLTSIHDVSNKRNWATWSQEISRGANRTRKSSSLIALGWLYRMSPQPRSCTRKPKSRGPVLGLALQPDYVIDENYRIHFWFTRLKH